MVQLFQLPMPINIMDKKQFKQIQFFFSDVDGTLTDGCTQYTTSGEFSKKFSHIDGTGFMLLHKAGIKTGLITGENSEIVRRRAEKLSIPYVFLNCKNKLDAMQYFVNEHQCTLANVAYIGDDINDLQLLQSVGLSFAPSDAQRLVSKAVNYHCKCKGGDGAFREAVEFILAGLEINSVQLFNQ